MVSKDTTSLLREGLRINSRMIKLTYLMHTHGSVVMQNDERKYYNEVGLWIHGRKSLGVGGLLMAYRALELEIFDDSKMFYLAYLLQYGEYMGQFIEERLDWT